jgi:hypothetical protein
MCQSRARISRLDKQAAGGTQGSRFYVDYANGEDDGGAAAALCAFGGLRILCAEPGSKTHEMGGQVVTVNHELIAFRRDRLGIEARSNRERFQNSGCGLRRRKDD